MNFNNDNSLQNIASIQSTADNFIGIVYSNVLNSYQTTLIPSTILYGIGSNLTFINYNNLSNLPSYSLSGANDGTFNFNNGIISLTLPTNYNSMTISNLIAPTINSISGIQEGGLALSNKYLGITSNAINASNLVGNPIINVSNINSTGSISGIGSNITLINYNTLSNLPNLSIYASNSSLSAYQSNLTSSTNINVSNINSTGVINLTSSFNDIITLSNSSQFSNVNINFINNATSNAFIGVGGTNSTFLNSSYSNNFFIHADCNIIFNANNNNNSNNPHLYISTTGNIGIGTSTNLFTNKLTINGSISGIGSNITLINYNTLSNLPNLSVYASNSSLNNYLLLSGGTITGDLTFNKANLNIQLTQTNGNNIGIPNAASNFSASAVANDMVIRSINNLMLQSGIGNAAIYIKNNNNVGIGTNNPVYKLDINGDSRVYNGTSQTNFFIGNGNSSAILNLWDVTNAAWQIASGNFNLSFNNGSVGGNFRNRMTILQNGNIGIGITNPLSTDLLTLSNSSNFSNINIKFINYANSNALIGVGGINLNSSYQNNFFIHATCNIILNAGSNLISTNPHLFILSNGNIGIGTSTNLNSNFNIIGSLNATTTITGTTINASANLQEGGTNLTNKYLGINSNAINASNLVGNPIINVSNINSIGSISGIGSNITLINYNTLSNLPNLSVYASNSSLNNYLLLSGGTLTGTLAGTTINASANLQEGGTNLTNKYLDINSNALNASNLVGNPIINVSNINSTGSISGIGSNITLINYNTLSNLPNLSIYASNSSLSAYQSNLTSSTNINVSNINSTGIINLTSSFNDIITLSNSSQFSNANINFINNATSNALIGVGGTNSTFLNSSYSNNFFIHANCNIILNANFNNNSNSPHLYISTTGNIGIGTSTNLNSNLTINGSMSVSNINATNIQQNNIDLNTLFTNTSNYSCNLLNNLGLQFPPKLYDSVTNETTTTFLGKTVYYQVMTINPYPNGYGIGEYKLYSSTSVNISTSTKNLLFDYIIDSALPSGHWGNNQYTSGLYNSSNNIISGYNGDWIIIKFPTPLILTRFQFYNRSSLTIRAPGEWKCYGSFDGVIWNEISTASQMTRLTSTNYSLGYYEKILSSLPPAYLYIGWTINKLVGSDSILNFNEIKIFGNAQNFLSLDTSNQSNISFINGSLRIYEKTGNIGSSASGSLVIEHGDIGGSSSITFPSITNLGNDYAFIKYTENITNSSFNYFNASSNETGALILGCENDGANTTGPDSIIINPSGNIALVPKNNLTYITGNIGIGITNPSTNDIITLSNSSQFSNVNINFINNASSNALIGVGGTNSTLLNSSYSNNFFIHANCNIIFNANNNNNSNNPHLYISTAGNIGIGTNIPTPAILLDINGHLYVRNNIYTQGIQPISDGTSKSINIRSRLSGNLNLHGEGGSIYMYTNSINRFYIDQIGNTYILSNLNISSNLNVNNIISKGILNLTSSFNDIISLSNSSQFSNVNINFINNATSNAFIGVGGTNSTFLNSSYSNNFFIHANCNIIFNANFNNNSNNPHFYISTTGNIGIGTSTNLNSNLTINGSMSVSNINATNIQQNNIDLNTLFTNTSNYSCNLLNNLGLQFPPKLYDSVTNETTTTFLGKTVYYQVMTINPYPNGYGIGEYKLYYSTSASSGIYRTKQVLFNYITNDDDNSTHWGINQYTNGGLYNSSNNIVSGYNGDWIIIKFPIPIFLTKFRIYYRPLSLTRAPGEWKCYGSFDGVIWNEISSASQMTRLTTTDYSLGYYEKILSSLPPAYLYIGWTINKLAGSSSILNFSELQIFGNTQNFLSLDTSNQSNISFINGSLRIYEKTGNIGSSASGSLVIEHGDIGGTSSITFPSITNLGNDYAFIKYTENITNSSFNYFNASSNETGALILGCENDGANTTGPDSIIINPAGNIALVPKNNLTYITGNIGIGITNPSTNDIITLSNSSQFSNVNINFINNATSNAFIGVGGTNSTFLNSSYSNNFFIHADCNIILNANFNNNSNNPHLYISATGNIGIGTSTNLNSNFNIIGSLNATTTITGTTINATADLQEGGTTLTNKYLKLDGANSMSGILTIIRNNNAPGIGTSGSATSGDRLILWSGSATTYPYSIGISSSTMWFSVPAARYAWYINGSIKMIIDSTGNAYFSDRIGIGITNPSGNDLLSLKISSAFSNANINFINNATSNAFIGVGATNSTLLNSSYSNNFFIHATCNIILNANFNNNSNNPHLYISTAGNIGIGTSTNLNSNLNIIGSLNATTTITGTTINATADLQEGGTTLTNKYLNINSNALNASNLVGNPNINIGTINATGSISGIGSNITLINYNTLSNLPDLSVYASNSSLNNYLLLSGGTLTGILNGTTINATANLQEGGTNLTSKYLNINSNAINASNLVGNPNISVGTINATGSISGIGSNITLINYNTLSNLPNLSVYASNSSLNAYQSNLTSSTNINVSNIDTAGGIAIAGSTAFYNPYGSVDSGNMINTYINFKEGGTTNDWCYLRQIGGSDTYKLAFDFHDNADARFCIRSINSVANPDNISEVFTVDNGNVTCTGNIGIGITNPSEKLHLSNGALVITGNSTNPGSTSSASFWNQSSIGPTISGNQISFQTNGTIERMRINTSGNIGIGLSSPSYKLHVTAAKTIASTAFAMKVSGGSFSDTGNFGTLIGLGCEDVGWTKCAIGHVRTGSWDRGDIVFLCRDTIDTVSCEMSNEIMRITKSGNIGIGITNPSTNDIITLSNSSQFSNVNINFINNASSNALIGVGGTNSTLLNSSYSNNFFIHADCNIILNANFNNNSTAPHFYISTTGNIGIGTSTNLFSNLNIIGSLNATTTITGTTINASANLQEGGTNLMNKYLGISSNAINASNIVGSPNITVGTINASGLLTGTTINASANLQEGGTNLINKYLGISSNALNASNLVGNPNINVGTINASGTITGNFTGNASGLTGNPNINVSIINSTSNNLNSSVNDAFIIKNTTSTSTTNIRIDRNDNVSAYIGIGATNYTTNTSYTSNLYIQSPTALILNAGNNISSITPHLFILSNGNIGIGTSTNLNSNFNIIGSLNATTTITGTTINASANLQEGGTNLTNKYLNINSNAINASNLVGTPNISVGTINASGLLTGITINASANLQEEGTNLTSKYLGISSNALNASNLIGNPNISVGTINATGSISGIGSNITLINYNNLSNLPDLSIYASNSSLNAYQSNLTFLTNINVSNINSTGIINLTSSFNDIINLSNSSPFSNVNIKFTNSTSSNALIGVGGSNSSFINSSYSNNFFIHANCNIILNAGNNQSSNSHLLIDINGNVSINNSLFTNFINSSNIITINSTTNNFYFNNYYALFNYTDEYFIGTGTYNVTFSTGSISINTSSPILNKSYPLLADINKNINKNIINPIIWYKFDNNNLLLDSGSLLNGDLIPSASSPTIDTTNYIKGNGSSYFLASSTQFYIIPSSNLELNLINVTTGISFSFWVKINYTLSGSNGKIFHFGNLNYYDISISRSGTSNTLLFQFNNVNGTFTYNINISTPNSWCHIVWTIDPNGIMNIYFNSSLFLNNYQFLYSLYQSSLAVADRTYYIGKSLVTTDGYLTMNLDDFRIYSKVLSANEVNELNKGHVDIYIKKNLGIGTINPNSNYLLDINGYTNINGNLNIFPNLKIGSINSSINNLINLSNSSEFYNANINFTNSTSSNAIIGVGGSSSTYINSSYQNNFFIHSTCNIILNAGSNLNANNPHLFINSNGNIGIGTSTNLNSKLNVDGNLNLNGDIILSTDTFHKSSDNKNRFNFLQNSGTTFYSGNDINDINNFNNNFTFLDSLNNDLFIIRSSTGIVTATLGNDISSGRGDIFNINEPYGTIATSSSATLALTYSTPNNGSSITFCLNDYINISYGLINYYDNVNLPDYNRYNIFNSSGPSVSSLVIGCEAFNSQNNGPGSVIINPSGNIALIPKNNLTYISGNIGIGITNPNTNDTITIRNSSPFSNVNIKFTNSTSSNALIGVGGSNSSFINSSYSNNFFIHANCNIILNAGNNQSSNSHLLIDINGNVSINNSLFTNFINSSNIITITSTANNFYFNNYYALFNYTDEYFIGTGTYNITFSTLGSISINTSSPILNKSYPLLADINKNIINPIIWYKFDNNNLLLDSGSLLNGNLIPSASSPTIDTTNYIKGNGSAYFSANSPYQSYEIPSTNLDLNLINITTGISFSFWVKINLTSSGNTGTIFDYRGLTINNNIGAIYISRFFGNNQLFFNIINDNFPDGVIINISSNVWYHIVFTIDKNGIWNIYSNNVLKLNNLSVAVIPQIIPNTKKFTINKIANNEVQSFTETFAMNLDDFRIYSKVLSSTEVNELYRGRVDIYIKKNLGIGTINPNSNYLLDINGYTNINGNLNIFPNLKIGSINSSINNLINLSNSSEFYNANINFTNSTSSNAIIGVGGSSSTYINSSYQNNFFIHSSCNIILNAGSNLNANNPHLFINSTGNIGIGTSTPNAKLEIVSGTASTGSANQTYFSSGSALTTNIITTSDICAIFNSSIWCKSKITTSSDIRIKNNINNIDNNVALQKILNIQAKTYNYIDKIEKGDNLIYGFIAQEIKEIIPEAVTFTSDFIPNIYTLCSNNSNIITIPENILSNINLNINDEINIIDSYNYEKKNYIIKEINSNQIIIDKNLLNYNCFVYGTKVNDFQTLNKDYIFTLNVCATQDLYKIIQEQQKQINNLYEILNKNNIS